MIRRRSGTEGLEVGQGSRVRHRIAAQVHRQIVAAVFALDPDSARHPPHRGVVEQHRLDQRLQQVHQRVVATDVREFVRQDRFELLRRQSAEHARRQKHDGLEKADDGRNIDER